jgi:hypothetical protein
LKWLEFEKALQAYKSTHSRAERFHFLEEGILVNLISG